MQTLHLLVKDEFIEEFVKSLPKEKVIVVEKEFKENKKLFQDELNKYNNDKLMTIPYQESAKELNLWLKGKA